MLSKRTKQSCPGAGLEVVVTQVSLREAVEVTMANVADFNHNVVHMGFSNVEVMDVVVANLHHPTFRIYHSLVIVPTPVQYQWCLDRHKIKMPHVMVVANVAT